MWVCQLHCILDVVHFKIKKKHFGKDCYQPDNWSKMVTIGSPTQTRISSFSKLSEFECSVQFDPGGFNLKSHKIKWIIKEKLFSVVILLLAC